MSLSLSSLLNPSPSAEGNSAHDPSSSDQRQHPTNIDAQWNQSEEHKRRSMSNEQRPRSSGHGDPIQLPPLVSNTRKMSSSTLEQYRVASRSPEQRRASNVSPVPTNITLPPLQGLDAGPHQPPGDGSQSRPHLHTSNMHATAEEEGRSPAYIKQENAPTPQTSSPLDPRPFFPESNAPAPNKIAALKTENSMRNSSPLRESSVPMPSTETPNNASATKKRPAPSKTKKGLATTTKKTQPAKKRKVEKIRAGTPSSRASKGPASKVASGKGTPINSSPAPSTRSQSASADEEAQDEDEEEDEDDDSEGDGGVYCICRKPDTGTFMIGCDGTCDDWFHGKCVSIDERDKNLIDKYICPNCATAGIGRTTWKRMCRRSGCRQAARIGKSKTGKQSSKYCSDECGVLFFKDMAARSRGNEDMTRHRSSRRRLGTVAQSQRIHDDDLGPRGGSLAAGEAKALVDSSKSADDFRRLGEGVLSPPATPDSKHSKAEKANNKLDEHMTEVERQNLARIAQDKEAARTKHRLLKDRMTFITMAKQASSRMATEKELKPKDYCGYDSRIQWTEDQFSRWRSSHTGKRALENETLSTDNNDANEMGIDNKDDEGEMQDFEICERKKCARHLDWPKLAVDDVRFEMADNSDRMRALETEERDVRERSALRAKRMQAGGWGKDGSVEVHSHAPPAVLTPPDGAAVGNGVATDESRAELENGSIPKPGTGQADVVMAD